VLTQEAHHTNNKATMRFLRQHILRAGVAMQILSFVLMINMRPITLR
jgi:hypothetical protein